MTRKSQQLQIRVTREQKAALKRLARRSGQGVSAYVLSRALPLPRSRFRAALRSLEDDGQWRYALAELNDLLSTWSSSEFQEAVTEAPSRELAPYRRNYVAAMVEQAAERKRVRPPAWLSKIDPLPKPHFATSLSSLRLHLLRVSPVSFRRRNIFVDSTLGQRV